MSFNDNNRYQRFIADLLDMLQDFDTELKQINPLTDGEKNLMVLAVYKRYQKYIKTLPYH